MRRMSGRGGGRGRGPAGNNAVGGFQGGELIGGLLVCVMVAGESFFCFFHACIFSIHPRGGFMAGNGRDTAEARGGWMRFSGDIVS